MTVKGKDRVRSVPVSVAIGVGVGILMTLLGTTIAALLLASERIGVDAIPASALIITGISVALGALAAKTTAGKQKMQVSLVTGVIYFLVLLAMNALFFGGQYERFGIVGILIVLVSALVGFTGLKPKKSGKMKHFKKAYR